MSMESFYGGRQGASFIIVYQFDGIDIPQDELIKTYKVKYYAVYDNKQYYICDSNGKLIEKNGKNFNNYVWKATTLNGDLVPAKQSESSTVQYITLDTVLAEGMVQCFKQGGASTDIVNYGEYVIIDPINKNNPDNGKVFRRGMDYLNDELGGAVYIGQIVGPQGETPELTLDNVNNMINLADVHILESTVNTGDLIPGDNSGNTDKIVYYYTSLKDENGYIQEYRVGLKIPYTVVDFGANTTNPYETENLITKNGIEYNTETGTWRHPFYQKWDIKIPKGIHGEDIYSVDLIYTKTKNNVQVYEDEECTIPISGVIVNDAAIMKEEEGHAYLPTDEPIYDIDKSFCFIEYEPNEIGYVKKEDCHKPVYRYKLINYDEGDGEYGTSVRYYYYYVATKMVDDVYIETRDSSSTYPEEIINDGTGDQKIHFKLTEGDTYIEKIIGSPLNYIIETTIINDSSLITLPSGISSTDAAFGHLIVYFSDPALRDELAEKFPKRVINYPSVIYKDTSVDPPAPVIFKKWFDLGQTMKDRTMPVLTQVDSINDLYDGAVQAGNGIPPERLPKKGTTTPIDETARGWGVIIPSAEYQNFYFFDYDEKEWIDSGTINSKNVAPKYVIAKSAESSPGQDIELNPGGFWFSQSTRSYADVKLE